MWTTNLIKVYSSSKKKLNFWENNLMAENLNEVHWHILFSQSFEELAKCSQNMSCGQCEVSKQHRIQRPGRGRGQETWNLCGHLWRPSFLWLICTGLGGPWPPQHPPGSATAKCLVYRHILKSIVKKLEEKTQKGSFSKLDSSLSVHMQSAVLPPPPFLVMVIVIFFPS